MVRYGLKEGLEIVAIVSLIVLQIKKQNSDNAIGHRKKMPKQGTGRRNALTDSFMVQYKNAKTSRRRSLLSEH
jgi:hypothetical protein